MTLSQHSPYLNGLCKFKRSSLFAFRNVFGRPVRLWLVCSTDVIAHTTILVFWTPDSCRSIFQYVNESINIDDYINQGKSGLAELRVPGGTLLALALVADGVLMIGALRRMRRWMSRPRSAIHFLRPP